MGGVRGPIVFQPPSLNLRHGVLAKSSLFGEPGPLQPPFLFAERVCERRIRTLLGQLPGQGEDVSRSTSQSQFRSGYVSATQGSASVSLDSS